MQVQVEIKQGSVIVAKASKKTTEKTTETSVQGKVFGYVVGRPANQQEHPDNKK